MSETKIDVRLTAAPLSSKVVPDLIHAGGPCITLLLPPYRAGEHSETAAALLKVELQQAAKDLSTRGIGEPLIATLLDPLYTVVGGQKLAGRLTLGSGDLSVGRHLSAIYVTGARIAGPSVYRGRLLLDPSNSCLDYSAGADIRSRNHEESRDTVGLRNH